MVYFKNEVLRRYRVRPSYDVRNRSGALRPGESGSWKRGVVSMRANARVGHAERRGENLIRYSLVEKSYASAVKLF